MGKGDSYRSVNKQKFNENFDRIFNVRPKHICKTWIQTAEKNGYKCYHCGEFKSEEEAEDGLFDPGVLSDWEPNIS